MSQALNNLMKQLSLVDQLIEIHGKLQNGRGRRHEQDALHRAGVVLTVAAWQAYIEKLVGEALDIIDGEMRSPQLASPQWAIHTFRFTMIDFLLQFDLATSREGITCYEPTSAPKVAQARYLSRPR